MRGDVRDSQDHALEDSTEARLRREIDDLKEQLQEHRRLLADARRAHAPARPSGRAVRVLFLLAAVLLAALFFAGWLPKLKRESQLAAEANSQSTALPRVTVATVRRAPSEASLTFPGNLQALAEAPILARADGYLKRRLVDIGDRVSAGQLLAEIEAPELDQQIQQAKAALQQAQAVQEQAGAALEQARSNEELARVTATRWGNLAQRGVVSRQENDQYQAQYRSQAANVKALEKALAAARASVGSAEANIARLSQLKNYQQVRAPFAGVITQRNVDAGALVSPGNTLLFRIAQTGVLRAYVSLPQAHAKDVRPGQAAVLTVPDLPGREFKGSVTRTSNALDTASRTLLVEVQVPNPGGILLPGMYAEVDLSARRENPPLLIPAEALVVRAAGTMAAVVGPGRTVHYRKIRIGRDYGDRMEIVDGLEEGQLVVVNPNDWVQEGSKVDTVPLAEPAGGRAGAAR